MHKLCMKVTWSQTQRTSPSFTWPIRTTSRHYFYRNPLNNNIYFADGHTNDINVLTLHHLLRVLLADTCQLRCLQRVFMQCEIEIKTKPIRCASNVDTSSRRRRDTRSHDTFDVVSPQCNRTNQKVWRAFVRRLSVVPIFPRIAWFMRNARRASVPRNERLKRETLTQHAHKRKT